MAKTIPEVGRAKVFEVPAKCTLWVLDPADSPISRPQAPHKPLILLVGRNGQCTFSMSVPSVYGAKRMADLFRPLRCCSTLALVLGLVGSASFGGLMPIA